jgi:hypothetical protein
MRFSARGARVVAVRRNAHPRPSCGGPAKPPSGLHCTHRVRPFASPASHSRGRVHRHRRDPRFCLRGHRPRHGRPRAAVRPTAYAQSDQSSRCPRRRHHDSVSARMDSTDCDRSRSAALPPPRPYRLYVREPRRDARRGRFASGASHPGAEHHAQRDRSDRNRDVECGGRNVRMVRGFQFIAVAAVDRSTFPGGGSPKHGAAAGEIPNLRCGHFRRAHSVRSGATRCEASPGCRCVSSARIIAGAPAAVPIRFRLRSGEASSR